MVNYMAHSSSLSLSLSLPLTKTSIWYRASTAIASSCRAYALSHLVCDSQVVLALPETKITMTNYSLEELNFSSNSNSNEVPPLPCPPPPPCCHMHNTHFTLFQFFLLSFSPFRTCLMSLDALSWRFIIVEQTCPFPYQTTTHVFPSSPSLALLSSCPSLLFLSSLFCNGFALRKRPSLGNLHSFSWFKLLKQFLKSKRSTPQKTNFVSASASVLPSPPTLPTSFSCPTGNPLPTRTLA